MRRPGNRRGPDQGNATAGECQLRPERTGAFEPRIDRSRIRPFPAMIRPNRDSQMRPGATAPIRGSTLLPYCENLPVRKREQARLSGETCAQNVEALGRLPPGATCVRTHTEHQLPRATSLAHPYHQSISIRKSQGYRIKNPRSLTQCLWREKGPAFVEACLYRNRLCSSRTRKNILQEQEGIGSRKTNQLRPSHPLHEKRSPRVETPCPRSFRNPQRRASRSLAARLPMPPSRPPPRQRIARKEPCSPARNRGQRSRESHSTAALEKVADRIARRPRPAEPMRPKRFGWQEKGCGRPSDFP